MTFTDLAENSLLKLFFQNTDWVNVGDSAGLQGSSTAGVFYISLHTASPTESGDQTTNESSYTNYARQFKNRGPGNWVVTGNAVDNFAAITYPAASSSGSIITHVGLGTDATGSGNLYIYAALVTPYTVTNGVQPEIVAGDLDFTIE